MPISDKELEFREIITKAVCGKGRRFSQVAHTVTPPNRPTNILGAWIINHKYEASKSGDAIEVIGTYDTNIWYSYDNNTKTDVAKETISYTELVPMTYLDPKHRVDTEEVYAVATQEPTCVEATVTSGGKVKILVDREYQVEMVAETKVCVVVNQAGCDDFEDKEFDFDENAADGDYETLDPDLLEDEVV